MSDYHEPVQELSNQARNFQRALNSLKEEIEAVDWYHQRVETSDDEELSEVMAHNRDEEIEHACMALEWLRRNMPGWEENLKTYLFSSEKITEIEEGEENSENEGDASSSDLGIGKPQK